MITMIINQKIFTSLFKILLLFRVLIKDGELSHIRFSRHKRRHSCNTTVTDVTVLTAIGWGSNILQHKFQNSQTKSGILTDNVFHVFLIKSDINYRRKKLSYLPDLE